MLKKSILFLLVFSFCSVIFSQNLITYNGSGNYILKERTDLRRYDNGKYIGLVSREVSSFISPVSEDDGFLYDGNFYILQETKRAGLEVQNGVNDAIPSVFKIDQEGQLTMLEDNGFPSFRSFPSFPKAEVKPGQSWKGTGERACDPLNKGIVTRMPMTIQYTYTGDSVFNGEEVYVLDAVWATRYGIGSGSSYIDLNGDSDLQKANGSHKAKVYVSKKSGNALLIRDTVDELFTYTDGKQIAFKGTISLFTEYPPSVETETLIPALKRLTKADSEDILSKNADYDEEGKIYTDKIKISSSDVIRLINENSKTKVQVEQTSAGLKLIIQDLQFKANSSELLEGEKERLDNIAAVLKQTPESRFLIEGHTADTGNPDGEKELSIERAHAVVMELSKRGIASTRFICKGSGGTKPVADNSTPEGRARNRRVEITILE